VEAEERMRQEADERRAADERWQQTPAPGAGAAAAGTEGHHHREPGAAGGDTAVMEPAEDQPQEPGRHAADARTDSTAEGETTRPTVADRLMGRDPADGRDGRAG
jgi:hypothetical protein